VAEGAQNGSAIMQEMISQLDQLTRSRQNMDRITEISGSALSNSSSVMEAGEELSLITQELRVMISGYQVS